MIKAQMMNKRKISHCLCSQHKPLAGYEAPPLATLLHSPLSDSLALKGYTHMHAGIS